MSNLIDELKQHHVFIRNKLAQVKLAGAENPDGREALKAVKASLLSHLAREDRELYPVLERAAASDERLADVLTVFRDDIAQVARTATRFFASFEAGTLKGLQLARELGSLMGQLSLRIAKEEAVLYAEYEGAARPTDRAASGATAPSSWQRK